MSIHKTLPDISATTPKISLFKYTSSGEELIAACIKQTEDFRDIALKKAEFMKTNQQNENAGRKPEEVYPCVILNATAVRLSLKSTGFPSAWPNYPAPDLIEPGECASFLLNDLPVSYEIQVFEGPVPFPPAGGGWQAPTADKSIPKFELSAGFSANGQVQPSTAKGSLQDMRGGGFVKCTFTWTTEPISQAAQTRAAGLFKITQSIP